MAGVRVSDFVAKPYSHRELAAGVPGYSARSIVGMGLTAHLVAEPPYAALFPLAELMDIAEPTLDAATVLRPHSAGGMGFTLANVREGDDNVWTLDVLYSLGITLVQLLREADALLWPHKWEHLVAGASDGRVQRRLGVDMSTPLGCAAYSVVALAVHAMARADPEHMPREHVRAVMGLHEPQRELNIPWDLYNLIERAHDALLRQCDEEPRQLGRGPAAAAESAAVVPLASAARRKQKKTTKKGASPRRSTSPARRARTRRVASPTRRARE